MRFQPESEKNFKGERAETELMHRFFIARSTIRQRTLLCNLFGNHPSLLVLFESQHSRKGARLENNFYGKKQR